MPAPRNHFRATLNAEPLRNANSARHLPQKAAAMGDDDVQVI
jgi:hypothetical protein